MKIAAVPDDTAAIEPRSEGPILLRTGSPGHAVGASRVKAGAPMK